MSTGDPTEPIVPPQRAGGSIPLRRQTSFVWGNAVATLLVLLVVGLIAAGAARSFVPGIPPASSSPSAIPTATAEAFTPRPLPSFTATPTPTPSPSPTPTARPTPTPIKRTPTPAPKTPAPTRTP